MPAEKRAQEKRNHHQRMPLTFSDDLESKAPYTVRCSSMSGEVWKIKGEDFYRLILRDQRTMLLLKGNIRERFSIIKSNEENRHDEFKFHNIEVPEVDSVFDERSERYVSSDEEECKNMQSRPERLVLKDLLVEAGTDYRE